MWGVRPRSLSSLTDLSTIQDADQVHVLVDGQIVSSGTFTEVRKNVPMVEEYVKLMSFSDD